MIKPVGKSMRTQNDALLTDPREMAVTLVYQIMEKGAYANLSLDHALHGSKMLQKDKNLVTELVNGSIRMIKHLDWVLDLFLRKSIDEQNPWVRSALRVATYQIMFMERIPDYAAVDSAVAFVRRSVNKTLAGVCNAVLRNLIRNKAEISYPPVNSPTYLAVLHSQPEWLVERWTACYGVQLTTAMLAYMNQKPLLTLRVNSLRTEAAALAMELSREGTQVRPGRLPGSLIIDSLEKSIEQLHTYQAGGFYLQSEAAMLAADILHPVAGDQVLDLCSGVGGKATHFAEKMNNQGLVKAVELHAHKLTLLQKNCQRLGVTIVTGEHADLLAMEEAPVWPKVFLDVPCSGLGVLNRRADARWRKDPGEIAALTKLQAAMLAKAGKMTAPGGILVYSTCTINTEENEEIVVKYLQDHPQFQLQSMAREMDHFQLDQPDREMAEKGWLTIIPGKYGCDGMFYARLRRSND